MWFMCGVPPEEASRMERAWLHRLCTTQSFVWFHVGTAQVLTSQLASPACAGRMRAVVDGTSSDSSESFHSQNVSECLTCALLSTFPLVATNAFFSSPHADRLWKQANWSVTLKESDHLISDCGETFGQEPCF